jgi:hypothetical protein
MLTTPWLGTHPLGWHLFGLLARWLAVAGAWVFLRSFWPDRRREAAVVAIVLALCPGFKQGPIPIIEPRHDWCYYYESADLSRQRGNWQAVADLGDQAFAVDHPNDPSGRLVFIEGYAHVGRWDRAEELSYAALEQNPAVNRMVCHAWERIVREVAVGADGVEAAGRVRERAACDDT